MSQDFFERPILNSPYAYPARHWELNEDGQPTHRIIEKRRPCRYITPVPKPKKRKDAGDVHLWLKLNGVDLFNPGTEDVRSHDADGIACWFIDTDDNEESFFVRHADFLGANDPYKALKTTLKAEINREAWDILHGDTSRPFPKPASGRIAVKVINHLGDEVMKVFRVG